MNNFLKQKRFNFELGPATKQPDKINHFLDFSTLSQCDYMIASSSTYAIAASLVGKNKKIIHSKSWLEKNINHTPWHNYKDPDYVRNMQLSFDNFWIKVAKSNSEYYKPWKIV